MTESVGEWLRFGWVRRRVPACIVLPQSQVGGRVNTMRTKLFGIVITVCFSMGTLWGQLTDQTQAPNTAKVGIAKSLPDEVGAGRGDANSWNSSIFVIQRDPFRSVRRGRQLFQRKFTRLQGQGSNEGDGVGELNSNGAIGAGLADSSAAGHGRPRGAAGSGGDVATRPDSRDAPHLF